MKNPENLRARARPHLGKRLPLALIALLALAALSPSSRGAAGDPQSSTVGTVAPVEGYVLEKGTRKPLAGVNVFILPARLKAITDARGHFVFEQAPEGEFTWIVNQSGYIRFEKLDDLSRGGAKKKHNLFLEKFSYPVYETTTYGQEDKRDVSRHSLRASEAVQIPGSNNDPIRALQNFPGINRPSAFQSQVIIQGSAPRDTRYLVDGHEVPLIFHFGGLSSVVPPEALDRVEYLSAGYGPEYGRAIGGLVSVWTRAPRTDRMHGMGFADLFSAGALLEGPAGGESSFLISARKSYVGEVLRAVVKNDSDFNFTAAPSYSDLTLLYEAHPTPIDRFRLLTVGSVDTLEFLLKEPVDFDPAFRGSFYTKTAFYRIIPQWEHRHDDRTKSRWSLGFGKDWFRVQTDPDYFLLNEYELTARGEVEHRFNDSWISQWGFDNRYTWANVSLLFRDPYFAGGVPNPFSSGDYRQVDAHRRFDNLGGYWRNEITLDSARRWSVIPAIRAEYYSMTHETFVMPRLAAKHKLSDSLELRAATGIYAQPPEPQETDPVAGNPDLKSPRAYHVAFSVEKDFREGSASGFTLTNGVYYRYFDQLVIPSAGIITRNGVAQAENFNNTGHGQAYGLETLLRMNLFPWTGWLAYTLSRSTRWEPGQPQHLYNYDQTHLLTLIGAVELGRNWRIAARFRYVTGNPYTPVTGSSFDADTDVYIPRRGAYYSERIEPFSQLDIRFDKRWIFNAWILSAYLDVQNATNRKNTEQIQYSYDYSSKTKVSGLPILPSIGLRGEF